jgi:hypothetical protein
MIVCALCGKEVRSVYALPGERSVKLCAQCFFKPPPTTPAALHSDSDGRAA